MPPLNDEVAGPTPAPTPPEPNLYDGIIRPIDVNGVRIWCDGYRYESGYKGALVFLSIFGPRNAVLSVWAKLRGREQSFQFTDAVSAYAGRIELTKDNSYLTFRAPIGEPKQQLMHIVVMNNDATHKVSNFAEKFFIITPTPESFFARLNHLCDLPMRREWAPKLWEAGLQPDPRPDVWVPKLIEPVSGYGAETYRVLVDQDRWQKLVLGLVKDGTLK